MFEFATPHKRKITVCLSVALIIVFGCTVSSTEAQAALKPTASVENEYSNVEMNYKYDNVIASLININTNSISTETAIKEAEANVLQKAWTFMAGKDYIDAASIGIKAQRDSKSGAVVFVSEGSKIDVVKKVKYLTKDQFVFVWKNEAYVFTPNTNAIVFRDRGCERVTANGTRTAMKLPHNVTWDYSQISWDKELGIVFADQYRSSYKYDGTTNQWTELSEYKMYGTPEQRFNKHLKTTLEGSYISGDINHKNPFELDSAEVQKYLSTGSDAECKSFKVVKDAAGKPAFILVASGSKDGLADDYTQYALDSFKRLNEVDPKIIRFLADKYNLSVFAKDIAEINIFAGYPGYQGTYLIQKFGSFILYNEQTSRNSLSGIKIQRMMPEYAKINIISAVMMESRALYDLMHLVGASNFSVTDQLSSSMGQDKALWYKQKVEAYNKEGKLSGFEYIRLRSYADSVYRYYGGK